MGKYGRANDRQKFQFFGGLVTRPDDHYIEAAEKGRVFGVKVKNVDEFKPGSIRRPLGDAQAGLAPGGTSVTVISSLLQDGVDVYTDMSTPLSAICQKITVGASTLNLGTVQVKLKALNYFTSITLSCVIKADTASLPGATVGTAALTYSATLIGDNGEQDYIFTFSTVPALSAATNYWVCLQALGVGAISGGTPRITAVNGVSGATTIKITNDNYGTYSTVSTGPVFHILTAASPSIVGLWDLRYDVGGALTQYYGTVSNGSIFAGNPTTVDSGGTWGSPTDNTAIRTGLSASRNYIYDQKTLKNYTFFTDYAQNNNRAWDGVFGKARTPAVADTASTMTHGYRPAAPTTAQAAKTAGMPDWGSWTATTTVNFIFVTQLVSGGYRARTFTHSLTAANVRIELSAIAVDAIAAEFSFDIAASATAVYMQIPGSLDKTYYKVPLGVAGTGGLFTSAGAAQANPFTNTLTALRIEPMADATLTAAATAGDIETNYSLPTSYFTLQVDTPKFKGLEVFYDQLAGWGDPNNPSSVWLSEQYAPQIWSTYGRTRGMRIDVAPDDGEIVTGIAFSDQALMVSKQHNWYRVDFTGDTNDPVRVRRCQGDLGTLSHFSTKRLPDGLYFISEQGPAMNYGTYSKVLPSAIGIRNLFVAADVNSFNQDILPYAVSAVETSENLVYTSMASHSSTDKDTLLVYDYEKDQFSTREGTLNSYVSIIGTSNGFPRLWRGTYDGFVYMRSQTVHTNGGVIQNFDYTTPFMDMGKPDTLKEGVFLWLSGPTQTAGNLYVDVFLNEIVTAYDTLTFDMTKAEFTSGSFKNIGKMFRTIRLRFRQDDSTGPCEITWAMLDYSNMGQRV